MTTKTTLGDEGWAHDIVIDVETRSDQYEKRNGTLVTPQDRQRRKEVMISTEQETTSRSRSRRSDKKKHQREDKSRHHDRRRSRSNRYHSPNSRRHQHHRNTSSKKWNSHQNGLETEKGKRSWGRRNGRGERVHDNISEHKRENRDGDPYTSRHFHVEKNSLRENEVQPFGLPTMYELTPYPGMYQGSYYRSNAFSMPKFWDQPNFVLALVGMPATGKTSQLRRLFLTRNNFLWGQFHWTFFFSPIEIEDIECKLGETWFSSVTVSLLTQITHWASTLGKALHSTTTKVLFVFDDMAQSLSELWKDNDFRKMFDQRRHLHGDTVSVSFIFTAQRFVNQIPKDIRRGLTDLILLPVGENDVREAIDSIGCSGRDIRKVAAKIWERTRYAFFYLTNNPRLATSFGYDDMLTVL